jgi:NTE family protein
MLRIFKILVIPLLFVKIGICAPQDSTSTKIEAIKVGLVFTGGGAKAAAQIGVLKVIEEAGIQIDMVSGTSMGSFIGALYAIGYDVNRIKEIFFQENWSEIMQGSEVYRSSLSMVEKKYDGRYIGVFPIRNWKIDFPTGLQKGQKLSQTISRYTWPVNHIEDFSLFQRPFLCIATDLATGEAVVFDKGFLPEVIHASMTFPSLMEPIKIDGRLLVDGGLIRNLPASDLKERGADIIIAIDVSAPLYEQHELNSIRRVIEQSASYISVANTLQQKEMCDLVITPDIYGYDFTSFEAIDILYERGLEAGYEVLDELIKLTNSEKTKKIEKKRYSMPLNEFQSIFINEIIIEGLKDLSVNLVLANLKITPGTWISPKILEEAIDRVYGSQLYETVRYEFVPVTNGVNLIVRVEERDADLFKFSIHYDTDLKSAVLLNATYFNIIGQGSRLAIDIKLSENPASEISYFVPIGWRKGLGFSVDFIYNNYEFPIYSKNEKTLNSLFDFTKFENQIALQSIFSNSFSVGIGIGIEQFSFKPIIASAGWEIEENNKRYGLIFGFIRIDSFDRTIFPKRGMKIELISELIDDHLELLEFNYDDLIRRFYFYSSGIIPLNNNNILQSSLTIARIVGPKIPPQYNYYIGGIRRDAIDAIPFAGLTFLKISGKNLVVSDWTYRQEMWNDIYLTFRLSIGSISENVKATFRFENPMIGYGIGIAVLSPIGPLEFSIMTNSEENNILSFLNIGYSF